jgi:tetratricopeptide (TPR) repeat protein
MIPVKMVQLAQGAALLADRFSENEFAAEEIASFRCRAWVELGNAYRVADELDRAEDALGRATKLLLVTDDDLLGARFFTVAASLFAARRIFDLACTAIELALAIHRRLGDQHLAGRSLIMKGIFTGYQGNPESAVRLIEQGLVSLDHQREPGLVFSSVQSQARFLVDCGRFQQARFVLWKLKQLGFSTGGRVNELKVRWLEGQIFVGLDQLDHPEQALQQAKHGFEEAGLQYKAALAGLEVGAVWLRKGRLEAAESVVVESTEVFLSLGIHRELLASILVLRRATEKRLLNLALLHQVIESLHKAEQDQGLQFQPPTEP